MSGSQGEVASSALITKTATRASPPCRPFGGWGMHTQNVARVREMERSHRKAGIPLIFQ